MDSRPGVHFEPSPASPMRRGWLAYLLVPLLLVAAIAPTLRWTELSSGSENLVVATVQEMHRDGPWLIPNLKGGPRITKPPLTTWTAASLVPRSAVDALSNPDPVARAAAYREFTWLIRFPALALSCLAVATTIEMGRMVGGMRVGIAAGFMAGTSLMFLRFGRNATTDVHLWLWVTVANVLLLHAILQDRRWIGLAGAGFAIGLAFMAKGPVALVQTIAPAAVGAMLLRPRLSVGPGNAETGSPSLSKPLLAGIAAMLLVGLPWYGWVWVQYPDILTAWKTEVTRRGATTLAPDPWWGYVGMLWMVLPWTPALLAGLWLSAGRVRDRGGVGVVLAMMLVPLVIMSFFDDKPERYMLPMLSPAAVLAAWAVVGERSDRPAAVHARNVQWIVLAVLAAAPLAMMFPLGDDPAWSDPAGAVGGAMAGLAAAAIAYRGRARFPRAGLIAATVVVMLLLQVLIQRGYANTRGGLAEMKPLADAVWAHCPDADVYYQQARNKVLPIDANIYLNRLVRTTEDFASLPVSSNGQAVLLLHRAREGEPEPVVPAGWQTLTIHPWGTGRYWYLLYRPPGG